MTAQAVEVSGWQVGSTVAASAAVVVAVIVTVLNLCQRTADKREQKEEVEARALAQARLVITGSGNPGFADINGAPGIPDAKAMLVLPFANWSDRAVLDVYGEVWIEDEAEPRAVHSPVVRSGQDLPLKLVFPSKPERFGGWCVRWTDADGRQWRRNRYPQDTPEPYTGEGRGFPEAQRAGLARSSVICRVANRVANWSSSSRRSGV